MGKASHPGCFSTPRETEIKQFINKLSEILQRIYLADPSKPKSDGETWKTKVTCTMKIQKEYLGEDAVRL